MNYERRNERPQRFGSGKKVRVSPSEKDLASEALRRVTLVGELSLLCHFA